MRKLPLLFFAAFLTATTFAADSFPTLPGVGAAMQSMVDKNEIAGAVTVVADKDRILHLESTGFANTAAQKPMTADTLFWIASMSKPVTGAAIMILQDEGKLNVADPVAKYLPEFANLKTPSGKTAKLTITQILTHTSGLGEANREEAMKVKTLAELSKLWLAAPMQYEPGEKWKYTQSGINAAGLIVEVVSGMPFEEFLQKRLFEPLSMTNTTFYPTEVQKASQATGYAKNKDTGVLEEAPPRADFGSRDRPPQGNGGLFSTPRDYIRFCQMLAGGGTLEGKKILSPEAVKVFSSVHTGELPCGFFQSEAFGNRGMNYGWGIGACVLKAPHPGAAEVLSAGSFGHGGAWGTQAWIDPVKGVAYVLMVQRANFNNSDASPVREAFQKAAAAALAK